MCISEYACMWHETWERSTHILQSIQHTLPTAGEKHTHTPVNPALYLRLERSTHILWSIQHSTYGWRGAHTYSGQSSTTSQTLQLERSTHTIYPIAGEKHTQTQMLQSIQHCKQMYIPLTSNDPLSESRAFYSN